MSADQHKQDATTHNLPYLSILVEKKSFKIFHHTGLEFSLIEKIQYFYKFLNYQGN
jgi:hypothetical protein